MKKAIILLVHLLMATAVLAQKNLDGIEIGSVLKLGQASASGYQHIDFPRKNIIIKRGAIVNYNALTACKVVVDEVHSQNGNTVILLKRKDGLNFFRFFPTVKASFEEALAKGELIFP